MSASTPKSVGEIEMFVTMLRTACEDPTVNEHLEKLLSMPDKQRQAAVHSWINQLVVAEAPRDFMTAVACLADDKVAEKAYEVIYLCQRGDYDRIGSAEPVAVRRPPGSRETKIAVIGVLVLFALTVAFVASFVFVGGRP